MYRQAIKPSSATKYLGINIDSKLNFNLHTKKVKSKTIARASHFRKITFKNKLIATKQASKTYKCICRPLLDYGHPILLNCNKPAKENIRIGETTALRRHTKIRHRNNPLRTRCSMIKHKFNRLSREQKCSVLNSLDNIVTQSPLSAIQYLLAPLGSTNYLLSHYSRS